MTGVQTYMEFSEITLNSKYLFDKYLKKHDPQISELTFTNFFAWRYYYRFRYAVIADLLCVIAVPGKGEPYAMMPLGEVYEKNFEQAYDAIRSYFHERGWKLCFSRITRDELTYFRNRVADDASIVYDRDNSDYLYLTKDLIELRGKKYDGKRNHINRFKREHTFEYVPLECSLLDECTRIMEEWCRDKDCQCQEGDYCERSANLEILRHFRTLGCKGALIRVDGEFAAFTVGEMLNEDTAVIHIEKARGSVNGLYAVINQQFAEHEWGSTTYINREQDLGLEGMRKAKLSYQPLMLVDKFTVHPV
jgi:hypothetical protein